MNRTRPLIAGGALALTLTIAACGGSASGGGSSGQKAPSSGVTVKALHVGGLSVLGNTTGLAVYTPAQEASGRILCTATNGCTSFWKPLTVTASPRSASGKLGRLGVIRRPDGTLQLTDNARPLYTFVQDSPGRVAGNGFKDEFGGQHFTWHVILSSGSPAGARASGTSAGSSGGGTSQGSGYSLTY